MVVVVVFVFVFVFVIVMAVVFVVVVVDFVVVVVGRLGREPGSGRVRGSERQRQAATSMPHKQKRQAPKHAATSSAYCMKWRPGWANFTQDVQPAKLSA